MRDLLRHGSCVVLAGALLLAASAALAEERNPGPTAPSGPGAPPPKAAKWFVPDMDSSTSVKPRMGTVKDAPAHPRKH